MSVIQSYETTAAWRRLSPAQQSRLEMSWDGPIPYSAIIDIINAVEEIASSESMMDVLAAKFPLPEGHEPREGHDYIVWHRNLFRIHQRRVDYIFSLYGVPTLDKSASDHGTDIWRAYHFSIEQRDAAQAREIREGDRMMRRALKAAAE